MDHFLGVHISRRHSEYYFCLLNEKLELCVLEKGYLDELLSYASGQDTRVTAVDAPAKLNTGLMQQESYRAQFDPLPTPNRWTDLRFGEYELVQKRMKITRTPYYKGACPQWIQTGIDLHAYIDEMGYRTYPAQGEQFKMEVPAEAAFQALLGMPLLPEETTEGKIQRQLLLWRMGVQVADPMLTFEEVTRFRLERGEFPYRNLLDTGQLLAIMSAFVAWLSVRRPDQIQTFGKEEEGLLVLPVQLIHH